MKVVLNHRFFLRFFFPSSFRPLEAEIARLCTWWPWDLCARQYKRGCSFYNFDHTDHPMLEHWIWWKLFDLPLFFYCWAHWSHGHQWSQWAGRKNLRKNQWFRTTFVFYSILKSQVWIRTWSHGHMVHRRHISASSGQNELGKKI